MAETTIKKTDGVRWVIKGLLWCVMIVYAYILVVLPLGIDRSSFIIHLLGNLVLFMPMGFLLPTLIKFTRQRTSFIMSIGVIIVIVKVIQLISFLGSFNVVDILLNISGALFAYLIWSLPEVQYIAAKLGLLPSLGNQLFSSVSPLAYAMGVTKNKLQRSIEDMFDKNTYSREKDVTSLPLVVYKHKSLIRRTLGQVDNQLQANKAINLTLAAPKIDGILIRPNETFSFWQLVGMCKKSKGYLPGLMIKGGEVSEGIGGGMCQMTNLIHWMVLHSPLKIIEHHHHGEVDMFPDYKRQIPFGTGTSIMHNYKDYRFTNHTAKTFQLRIRVGETHLMGELRTTEPLPYSYHIVEENAYFTCEKGTYYRHNQIYRRVIDKHNGNELEKELIMKNHAKVLYNQSFIPETSIRIFD